MDTPEQPGKGVAASRAKPAKGDQDYSVRRREWRHSLHRTLSVDQERDVIPPWSTWKPTSAVRTVGAHCN